MQVRATAAEFLNSWRPKLAGQGRRPNALTGRPIGAGAPGRKVKVARGEGHRHRRCHGYREETTLILILFCIL